VVKLRTECLQLNALHAYQRRNETETARSQRRRCPCCDAADETTHHFLFACPAYDARRAELKHALRGGSIDLLTPLLALPEQQQVQALLNPRYWGDDASMSCDPCFVPYAYTIAIARFVAAAWRLRSRTLHARTALNGRETDAHTRMV
jgi:hypothetical protein